MLGMGVEHGEYTPLHVCIEYTKAVMCLNMYVKEAAMNNESYRKAINY